MAQPIPVKAYASQQASAWDSYVQRHAQATVFHRRAWSQAVQNAYGHQPCHLTAWNGDSLVGLLPLFEVKSLLAGRVLISLPYATYGGILSDNEEAAATLLAAAEALCRERKAVYIELRHRESNSLALPRLDRYDTFRRTLPAPGEDLLTAVCVCRLYHAVVLYVRCLEIDVGRLEVRPLGLVL